MKIFVVSLLDGLIIVTDTTIKIIETSKLGPEMDEPRFGAGCQDLRLILCGHNFKTRHF